MSGVGYEFQKQLAVKDALLAEWELKNRALRESIASSIKKGGDLEERLVVQKGVYEDKLRISHESLMSCSRQVVEAMKIMKASEVKLKTLQESHGQQVAELNERIATQDTVIEDLTSEHQMLTEELHQQKRRTLEGEVDYLKNRNRVLNKLEGVLNEFT